MIAAYILIQTEVGVIGSVAAEVAGEGSNVGRGGNRPLRRDRPGGGTQPGRAGEARGPTGSGRPGHHPHAYLSCSPPLEGPPPGALIPKRGTRHVRGGSSAQPSGRYAMGRTFTAWGPLRPLGHVELDLLVLLK